jgi:ATP-binding cassette subfamily B protein
VLLPLALVDGLLDGGLTLSYKFLVDSAIMPHNAKALTLILSILIAGALAGSALSIWRDLLYAKTVGRLLHDLRDALFARTQCLSASFRAHHPASDIVARFSVDLAGFDAWLSGAINSLVLPVMNILTGIALLFVLLPWQIAIFAVLVWPIVLIGPRLVAPHAAGAAFAKRADETALLATVQEALVTDGVVRAFNLEAFARRRFMDRLTPLSASTVRAAFFGLFAERSTVISIYLVQIVSVAAGALLAFNGRVSVGSYLAFLTAFWNLGWSTVVIARSAPTIALANVAVRRLDEFLHEPAAAATGGPALPELREAIEFDGVAVSYPDRGTVLAELSFRIGRGEVVAFVGPSGSGKSSIFNLLAGFIEPAAGRIMVDGRDVAHYEPASRRAQMAFVFQESVLFNATVADNIRLGSGSAPDLSIEAAARLACVHDAITALPDGFATLVGEGGAALSGGQRQRIGIARALLREPAVLLLDEATSALDPKTEGEINATLLDARMGRTVIAITHHLPSVTNVDRIYVVNDGGIEESGTHEALLARDGTYADLWRKQTGLVVSDDGAAARITAERLRSIELLHTLAEPTLSALAATFSSVRAAAGQVVIRQDEPGDLFYVIARGQVAVTRIDAAGRNVEIATLHTGEEFGELALLLDVPRTATVTALVDSLFLTLSRSQFQSLVDDHVEIREHLTQLSTLRGFPTEG